MIKDAKKNKTDDKKKSLIIHFKKHRWNIRKLPPAPVSHTASYTLLLVLYTQINSRQQKRKQVKEKSNLRMAVNI